MDEEQRKRRELDALEGIAVELEYLRLLREYELSTRVGNDGEGNLYVMPLEDGGSVS